MRCLGAFENDVGGIVQGGVQGGSAGVFSVDAGERDGAHVSLLVNVIEDEGFEDEGFDDGIEAEPESEPKLRSDEFRFEDIQIERRRCKAFDTALGRFAGPTSDPTIHVKDKPMQHAKQFYIDGQWVDPQNPAGAATLDVIDPSTAAPFAQTPLGSAADVDRAVAAAKRAFPAYSETTIAQRIDLLQAILDVYRKRYDDMVHAISREMGAPLQYANDAQAWTGVAHLETMIRTLDTFEFEYVKSSILIRKQAVGVCGLITPWNWPALQIATKVVPALAAGCTMVLKPSELAPLSGIIFAEILDEAGVPTGVFNLVNGEGATVGEAMSR